MPINVMDKELIAVGISVAAGCRPCTDYHLKKAAEAGAADEEILQAISDALCVKRNAADVMAVYARALSENPQSNDGDCGVGANRIGELVKIGAAFAVNCTQNLDQHRTQGKGLGITEDEIVEIIELAAHIKDKAASHVEKVIRAEKRVAAVPLKADTKTCC